MQSVFATILPIVMTALGTVLTGLAAIYVPRLAAAFTAHTGVVISEQQRQVVLGAISTAAGVLETSLDNGILQRASVTPTNLAVRAQAQAVMSAVPDAASKLGVSMADLSRMIVGRVDTGAHPPAPPMPVPVGIPAPVVQAVFERPQTP